MHPGVLFILGYILPTYSVFCIDNFSDDADDGL